MSVKRILFVCMGNICRSPSAEAVMRGLVDASELSLELDSAGTIAHHAGERADARMQKHAQLRHYDLTSISRQVLAEDFKTFDLLVAMDDENMAYLLDRAGEYKDKVCKMTDFSRRYDYNYVPDPYYGGAAGFELVLDLLEDACQGLLDYCRSEA